MPLELQSGTCSTRVQVFTAVVAAACKCTTGPRQTGRRVSCSSLHRLDTNSMSGAGAAAPTQQPPQLPELLAKLAATRKDADATCKALVQRTNLARARARVGAFPAPGHQHHQSLPLCALLETCGLRLVLRRKGSMSVRLRRRRRQTRRAFPAPLSSPCDSRRRRRRRLAHRCTP